MSSLDSECFVDPCLWPLPDPGHSAHEHQKPHVFPSPFSATPHLLAQIAADDLKIWLEHLETCPLEQDAAAGIAINQPFFTPSGGKMFGVLVVETRDGGLAYLRGFSGMLAGRWQVNGFVPPLFDEGARREAVSSGEARLAQLTAEIQAAEEDATFTESISQLKRLQHEAKIEIEQCLKRNAERKQDRARRRTQLKHLSPAESSENESADEKALSFESQEDKRQRRALQQKWKQRLAKLEGLINYHECKIAQLKERRKALSQALHEQVFAGYELHNALGESAALTSFYPAQKPPGGAADCAAPKLIQYAVDHGYTPLALAEFWWGSSPSQGVRQHGRYYPSCRGKCRPILPFMLAGRPLEAEPEPPRVAEDDTLEVVYEDQYLVVVDKPAGLLSVPGKEIYDSVYARLRQRYPDAKGPLVVHRLDLATSGLLLAAKTMEAHRHLQRQFMERQVEKRYTALLDGELRESEGHISLPLRVDLDDRPRQLVCHQHGKPALTYWQLVTHEKGYSRVYFSPHTGRTHQLRLHAAHPRGLGMAIVGDELYGSPDQRLMLHAERLRFAHPETGLKMEFQSPVPF